MFSETALGSFLRRVYSGSHPDLMRQEAAIALASLLLADDSALASFAIRNELREVLNGIYGDKVNWRSHEPPVSEPIQAELKQVLREIVKEDHPHAKAYIMGLLGIAESSLAFAKTKRSERIHSKMLRIFYGRREGFSSEGKNLFVGIVGLKGSGKSSILRILEREGDEVLEVYRELDHLKQKCPERVSTLPPRENWEDEPLRLVLDERGVTAQTRRTIFLGSLLRMSELELLSQRGKAILVHVGSTNRERHSRARLRGRAIEKNADQGRLVELDAHRDGLWPAYEQNDHGIPLEDLGQRVRDLLGKGHDS